MSVVMVVMMVFFLRQMANPDVVASERQGGAEEGTEQPQDACDPAAQTAGVDGINPATEFVGSIGIGIKGGGSNLA